MVKFGRSVYDLMGRLFKNLVLFLFGYLDLAVCTSSLSDSEVKRPIGR